MGLGMHGLDAQGSATGGAAGTSSKRNGLTGRDSRYAKPSAGGTNTTTDAGAPSTTARVKQTLGGKVLSAIALERVTGRKPDPRRFKELK